jgi:hypothetical protein
MQRNSGPVRRIVRRTGPGPIIDVEGSRSTQRMTARIARLRGRLSYANATASLALFVALGGTSYAAITLPRNSVGSKQIRAKAVRSSDIRNRAIKLTDISTSTRAALHGQQGPQGPAGAAAVGLFATVNSGGGVVNGTLEPGGHEAGSNVYEVKAKQDVSRCGYSATLAAVQNGPTLEEPPAGRITVASAGGDRIRVKTYDAAGNPTSAPFHLLVAC